MDFEIAQMIDAPVGAVEELLFDADFVAATSGLPKLSDCRMIGTRADGTTTQLRIHRRFDDDLPGPVTAVIDPRRLTWVEEVTWGRSTHRGDHVIRPEHYADRLRCSFTTILTDDRGGCHRVATGRLTVRASLASRTVERAIISGLREYAEAEAGLLATWARG